MKAFGELSHVDEMADVIRDATDEVVGLKEDVANLVAAGEKALMALLELDGGDPTDETGWHDPLALDAWMALTVAIGIAKGRQ
jgi:hypothetical protein